MVLAHVISVRIGASEPLFTNTFGCSFLWVNMNRSKPFGCSIVCINGFLSYDLDLTNSQLEEEEKAADSYPYTTLMICTVALDTQSQIIPILQKRGWEKLTTYYTNQYHDYRPLEIWCKRFDRRSEERQSQDAEAGVSILLRSLQ